MILWSSNPRYKDWRVHGSNPCQRDEDTIDIAIAIVIVIVIVMYCTEWNCSLNKLAWDKHKVARYIYHFLMKTAPIVEKTVKFLMRKTMTTFNQKKMRLIPCAEQYYFVCFHIIAKNQNSWTNRIFTFCFPPCLMLINPSRLKIFSFSGHPRCKVRTILNSLGESI